MAKKLSPAAHTLDARQQFVANLIAMSDEQFVAWLYTPRPFPVGQTVADMMFERYAIKCALDSRDAMVIHELTGKFLDAKLAAKAVARG